ncbi:MAG TPA: S1-like domain-containing RNA-binding protein, partial [Chitinophagaceae bacterium]|nr:S1-like domain-containing RNA-binding protein [Chitinophagaceae bacterium]
MIYIGEINRLKIIRNTSVGMYLSDKINNEVLLPKKYILEDFKIDDIVEVFVYKDYDERLVATTLDPYILVNEFGYLRVRTVTQFGAFLEWGMEKDLMVPKQEQSKKMEVGESYMVYLYLDEATDRLIASSKINKFINNEEMDLKVGDEVELIIFETTFLGYNAIVNNAHKGLIYHDEIYQDIHIGDKLVGYVKNIRDDFGMDISLQKIGVQHLVTTTDGVLSYLQKNKGFLALTDDSSPEEIKKILSMSKKAFKKSV